MYSPTCCALIQSVQMHNEKADDVRAIMEKMVPALEDLRDKELFLTVKMHEMRALECTF